MLTLDYIFAFSLKALIRAICVVGAHKNTTLLGQEYIILIVDYGTPVFASLVANT